MFTQEDQTEKPRYFVIKSATVWYGTNLKAIAVTTFEGPDAAQLAEAAARDLNLKGLPPKFLQGNQPE